MNTKLYSNIVTILQYENVFSLKKINWVSELDFFYVNFWGNCSF